MKPENLPTAPYPRIDPIWVHEILEEAKEKPLCVQIVLVGRLLTQAEKWREEMLDRKTSLRPMTEDDIRAYSNGFVLPLTCLSAARYALETGESEIASLDRPQFKPLRDSVNSFVQSIKRDPSAILLIGSLAEKYPRTRANPYLIRGLELCAKVYIRYWVVFEQYADEVDLW